MDTRATNIALPTCEWLHDGQIVVFKTTENSRPAVDAWFEMVKSVMLNWPDDEPFLAVQDFSDQRITVTPYSRAKNEELYRLRPDLQAFMAVILPKTFAAQLFQLLFRFLRRDNWQSRVFPTRHAGIQWLEMAAEFTVRLPDDE